MLFLIFILDQRLLSNCVTTKLFFLHSALGLSVLYRDYGKVSENCIIVVDLFGCQDLILIVTFDDGCLWGDRGGKLGGLPRLYYPRSRPTVLDFGPDNCVPKRMPQRDWTPARWIHLAGGAL